MSEDWPDDVDGNALRMVAAEGHDLSQPMAVDFPVVFCDQPTAQRFAEVARKGGYTANLYPHDDDPEWDVICVKRMLLTYDAVVAVQAELNDMSKPLGGYCDGWGTFGNKD